MSVKNSPVSWLYNMNLGYWLSGTWQGNEARNLTIQYDIFNLVHLFSYAPHPYFLKWSSLICGLSGLAFPQRQSPPGRGLVVWHCVVLRLNNTLYGSSNHHLCSPTYLTLEFCGCCPFLNISSPLPLTSSIPL